MKYLQFFEYKTGEANIGYYVICKENPKNFALNKDTTDKIIYFTSNNVGKIIEYNEKDFYEYVVQFENVPEDIKEYFTSGNFTARVISSHEIKECSKDKEKLELMLSANRYNL